MQARKRDEVLSKIPETISVVTAAQIEKAGVRSVDDIGRLTPNVRLNQRQDNEPNVVIRGVGSFGNTQGVGFYIDDVQNFTDQTAAVEDVERIDILKGPQGTLYGGSNVGGAIKYVMAKPTDKFGLQARAEYGTFDTTRLFGAINVPVAETLAVRVSSYYKRTDGFVRNVFLDRQSDAKKEWGIRGALRWTPTDALTVDLSYRHNQVHTGGNVYVVYTGDDYSREVSYDQQGSHKRVVDGGILTAKYDMGFADFTSVTSYTRRKYSFRTDQDYSPFDVLVTIIGPNNETKVFTQEARLASSGEGPFTWLVGAYYAQIDDPSPLSRTTLHVGLDMPPPPDGIGPGPFDIPLYDLTGKFRQKAVFGTVGYRTGPFKIEAGLRVGRSEFSETFRNFGASAKSNGTKVLPKFTLSYDVDNNMILYGNIGVGSEPGRVNTTSPVPYKAEQATSVEFGLKGSALDRRLNFDLAAFYIDYKDRQLETQFLDSNGVLTEAITNIGKSRGYGVEAGLTYRPIRELTFSASGGYLHSKWHDKNAQYQFQSVDGLYVANSPKFTGNASVDYTQEIGGDLALGLRAEVSHTSSFFWDVLNTGKQKTYDLVNLRASLGRTDSGWEFAIRGENVFNKKYYDDAVPNIFGPGVSVGAPGRPASITASISLKY
ncbi:hypothetical protein ASE00_01885 [Sphingomonas sp. Root710]|uniref:TonB-dependent receptor n=1 Tax=Sphingomonas sp. Root710 TaxID=1736594 RepID=UPI0006F78F41|nr:TonB-dependent receptor [Sphingomonas sp. Root710]KRB85570.1 hypothetical protein ASE00_01885 [Sphingomonas sp. Root710]